MQVNVVVFPSRMWLGAPEIELRHQTANSNTPIAVPESGVSV